MSAPQVAAVRTRLRRARGCEGTIFVHSADPSGAETIVRVLRRWNHRVRRATA
ncbi:hypothetical protein [Actinomadura vinacea]|uniref:hypothetical protein n=1 Tax=Actinomadura vinacea TaxID=115336 RepID=UPI0031D07ECC